MFSMSNFLAKFAAIVCSLRLVIKQAESKATNCILIFPMTEEEILDHVRQLRNVPLCEEYKKMVLSRP